MSHLMSLFSLDDPVPEVVESHPLHELCSAATHTYPSASAMLAGIDHNDCRPSAIMHTYPLQPALSSNEESAMELDNPWQFVHRARDDNEQPVGIIKFFLKEVDQSSKLREDITLNVRESQMQSAIAQHQQQNQSLQHDSANALASLDENHRKEVAELQNNMVLDRQKAQTEAHTEIERFLAEKESWFEHEMGLARDRLLADNESELTRLDTYSESDADEEPQTDSRPSLTSLLGDVPITNATIGMLAEVLAKVLQTPQMTSSRGPCPRRKQLKPPVESFMDTQRRDNKANVRELFKNAFHATKDEEFMLHVSASHEAILSFAYETGPGPDPLAMQWDMTTTHNSMWNQHGPHSQGDGTHDQAVWEYLWGIVENLGKDGMSSDEISKKKFQRMEIIVAHHDINCGSLGSPLWQKNHVGRPIVHMGGLIEFVVWHVGMVSMVYYTFNTLTQSADDTVLAFQQPNTMMPDYFQWVWNCSG
ncbi:hypothetical protein EV702DRAFT_1044486 [Suillus placidus]|uniref:Uncharacterized protein n=1 Tax=Suillus placidus TaxID=48579 RepID=A0A9P6ZXG8_9AGAM|nr:hypothetical protein EV702DRAFT_1044486 [Suillus placidus]